MKILTTLPRSIRFLVAAVIAAVLVVQGDPTVGTIAAAMTIFGGPFGPRFEPNDGAAGGGSGAATANPPAGGDGAGILMTQEQLDSLIDGVATRSAEAARAAVASLSEAEGNDRRRTGEDDVTRRGGGLVPERDQARVGQRRDVDGDDGWKIQLYRLMWGVQSNHVERLVEARSTMIRAGHYGMTEDQFRALHQSSTTGAPWLPTMALDRIDYLASQYGAARRLVNVWTGLKPGGTYKVPKLSGRPQIRAVGEASEILTRNFTTGSISLTPKKWGLILGFTPEMEEVIAVQAITKMIEALGESKAEMEDMTVFTADGSATYHNITGILANTSVPWVTLPSTKTDFEDVDYGSVKDMRKVTHVASRKRGAYVFHPDIEEYILDFVSPAGDYIFDQESDLTRIRNRPVEWTEALPNDSDSAVSTAFGAYGDFSHVHMGLTDRGPEVKRLDQATIRDPNDTDLIRLALTDQEALRFIWEWDVVPQFPDAVYSKIRTAAS